MDADAVHKLICENRIRLKDRRMQDMNDLIGYLDGEFARITPNLKSNSFVMRIYSGDLWPYLESVSDMAGNLEKTIQYIFERDTPKDSEYYFKVLSSMKMFDGECFYGQYYYRVEIVLTRR